MTSNSRYLLLTGLLALAACDQSGGGGAGGSDANGAAADPMQTAAEAEADPANTLENQMKALDESTEGTANQTDAN